MRIATTTVALLFTLSLAGQQTDDVIIPQAAAPVLLVPVAGNTPGGNGTHFRSDIHLLNLRDVPQRVAMTWMPQGGDGTAGATRTIEIAALSGMFSEDFVHNILEEEGLGGIHFAGVTADGQLDPAARLHVSSRIWTPRPDGAAGTYSQSFPSVILPSGSASNVKTLFGLRHGAQYRLNVGINNASQQSQRFNVTVRVSAPAGSETTSFQVTLLPMSIEQRGVTLSAEGVVQVLVERITGGAASEWQMWASSVDNASGDAWSNLGFAVQ